MKYFIFIYQGYATTKDEMFVCLDKFNHSGWKEEDEDEEQKKEEEDGQEKEEKRENK